ncbi:MAG: heparinase II/III-family protein [Ignavibacteria bacterium]|nr:heparinase II/III-family protein [Ignavibacteria bacterium]
MSIFDSFRKISFTSLKKTYFRRDVESAFYLGKPFSFPKVLTEKVFLAACGELHEEHVRMSERLKLFSRVEPQKMQRIVTLADGVLEGRYECYNSLHFTVPDEINWHLDYIAGFEYPILPAWKVEPFSEQAEAELGIPLFLGSFYQVSWLAASWLYTGQAKYKQKAFQIIAQFSDENPIGVGVQWFERSVAATRLINLYYSLTLLGCNSPEDGACVKSAMELVLAHTVYLELNTEIAKAHDYKVFLVQAALLIAGKLLHASEYGKRLSLSAIQLIEQEIRKQVRPDGVMYFHSIPAHAITLEVLAVVQSFCKGEFVLSKEFYKIYAKMTGVFEEYRIGKALFPNIGDAVLGGVLEMEERNWEDKALSILELARVRCGTTEILHKEGCSLEMYLVVDEPDKITIADTRAKNTASIGLHEGGHYLLRDKDISVFIKAAEIGRKGSGPPGHNDSFTFELDYRMKQFIVDSGTYSFFAKPEVRNSLRSVMHHNTFYVDHTQLAEFVGTMGIKSDLTKPSVEEWNSDEGEDNLTVQHFAYVRLEDPVICKRSFRLNKNKRKFRIKDEFLGGSEHTVISNLYLHPEVVVTMLDPETYNLTRDGDTIQLRYHFPNDNLDLSLQDTVYSPSYGVLLKSKRLHLQYRDKLPAFYKMEFSFL